MMTIRVGDDVPALEPLATVKSPKSTAFPNVAVVINSIILPPLVPANIPRVELSPLADPYVAVIVPKSVELPVVDIVINSEVVMLLSLLTILVLLHTPIILAAVDTSPKSTASPVLAIVT